jgi:hypothetical protein
MLTKLFTAAFLCLCLFTSSCKKGSTTVATAYRGKVVSIMCGLTVIDIEGNAGIGSAFTANGTTYTNAVGNGDFCYLGDKKVQQGTTIAFNITPEKTAPDSHCAVPACYNLNAPNKSVYINDVVIVSQ